MDGDGDSVARGNDGVDWAGIFDLIASEYGYTWRQFTRLTYKQLDACLEAIARRTHNHMAALAAMHGIKIDLYRRMKAPSKTILKRAHTELENALAKKQAKIKKRHGER